MKMNFSAGISQEFWDLRTKELLMGLLNSKNTYFPEHLAMAASDRTSNQEYKLNFL